MTLPMNCCALVATKNRFDALINTSLPCISHQDYPPNFALIVNDGNQFSETEYERIAKVISPIPYLVINNTTSPGVAGAWNSGLQYLISSGFKGFVAMLDDDDRWDNGHISLSLATAQREKATIVISGLRMLKDGILVPRMLISGLSDRQFLISNPGWQASNTFVHIDAFKRIRGFRNGLMSTNDRDLAIRLLRDPANKVSFTRTWTASWHYDTNRMQLSTSNSRAKLSGLRWFWHFYSNDMIPEEIDQFFSRSKYFFGYGMPEITAPGDDLPSHRNTVGDLDEI